MRYESIRLIVDRCRGESGGDKKNYIYFIGICGISIGGIAQYCIDQGISVKGVDNNRKKINNFRNRNPGIDVSYVHSYSNIDDNVKMIVYSPFNNIDDICEMRAGRKKNLPVINRVDFIKALIDYENRDMTIGVTGSSGKTSISSYLSQVLINIGLEPSVFCGSYITEDYDNSCIFSSSRNSPVVFEVDESNAYVLNSLDKNYISILTIVHDDHIEAFNDSFECLKDNIIANIEKSKVIVYNKDCNECCLIIDRLKDRDIEFISYGVLSEGCDIKGVWSKADGMCIDYRGKRYYIDKLINDKCSQELFLFPLMFKHMFVNLLGVIGCLLVMKRFYEVIEMDIIIDNISLVKFPHNRMQQYYSKKSNVLFVYDYGHNGIEIINNIRSVYNYYKNIIVIIEPHKIARFNRYKDMLNELRDFVTLFVLPVQQGDGTQVIDNVCDKELEVIKGCKFIIDSEKRESLIILGFSPYRDLIKSMFGEYIK